MEDIYQFWNSMYDMSVEKQVERFFERLRFHLELNLLGFQKSYSKFSPGQLGIIFNSEWCRVYFYYRHGHYMVKAPKLDEFSITYGRLHAPDEEATMIWQGQKCNCWHNNRLILFFLDGLTPQDVVNREKEKKMVSDIRINYRQSREGQQLVSQELWAELKIRYEAATWQHYGQRLFEVFDLRQPDLWEEYTKFNSEYHRRKARSPQVSESLISSLR